MMPSKESNGLRSSSNHESYIPVSDAGFQSDRKEKSNDR